jgi:hypothetical protein
MRRMPQGAMPHLHWAAAWAGVDVGLGASPLPQETLFAQPCLDFSATHGDSGVEVEIVAIFASLNSPQPTT